MPMLRENYDAACDLYDELRAAATGGADWNNEVSLAWGLLIEMARACARDTGFRATSQGQSVMVSALRRNVPLLEGTN